MKEELYTAAKKYIEVIEKIERTNSPKEQQQLEEKRVDLHWKFIDLLKKHGIAFKDRDNATRLAQKIVKDYETH